MHNATKEAANVAVRGHTVHLHSAYVSQAREGVALKCDWQELHGSKGQCKWACAGPTKRFGIRDVIQLRKMLRLQLLRL